MNNEILKLAIANGILTSEAVESILAMEEKKKYLNKHNHAIWQGKDGCWYTYMPKKDGNGRLLKKRASKASLENIIVSYYKEQETNPSVEDIFIEWSGRRAELGQISLSTYERDMRIFKKHFSDFGKRKIKTLEACDFSDFLEEQVAKFNLTAKSFCNLKSITRGILKRCKKLRLISFNTADVFDGIDMGATAFKKVIKEDYQEVFDDNEMSVILNFLSQNLDAANTGIYLMFVTGIRVGELVALKHDDIDEISIKIRRTESRYKDIETGKYIYAVKEFPKSEAGVRTVVLPQNYIWLLKKLKTLNPFGEYIFTGKNGRMSTNSIRTRLKTICKNLGIYPKSPHKIRKTYGTILLDNNIDHKLIMSMMGHTDILCTENHYHRNRRTLEAQKYIISQIPEFQAK